MLQLLWQGKLDQNKGIESLPQIPIYLQPDGVHLWYFKQFDHSLKYFRKSEFVSIPLKIYSWSVKALKDTLQ